MDFAPLIKQAAELSKNVVAAVDPDHFGDPTPCTEYDVRKLTEHIAAFAPYSAAAATKSEMGEHAFEPDSFKTTYASDVDAMAEAWSQPGAMEGEVTFGRGEMPADRAAAITLHELVLHGWDLAKATGQPFEVGDDVAAIISAIVEGGVQAGGRDDGVYGPEVTVADDASAFEHALGVSGRDPGWSA